MLDISKDIHSLSDFRRHTSRFVEALRKTGRPVILTLNGRAEMVIQDAASYQKLLDAARELELLRAASGEVPRPPQRRR